MTEQTQTMKRLWSERVAAWEKAHKHGWKEPWATRARDAADAYDRASAGANAATEVET